LAWRWAADYSHGGSQGFKFVASAFGLLAAIAVLLSLDDFGSKERGKKVVGVASRFYDCSGFVHAATSY